MNKEQEPQIVDYLSKGQKLNRLKELSKMYALYEPYRTTYKRKPVTKRTYKNEV